MRLASDSIPGKATSEGASPQRRRLVVGVPSPPNCQWAVEPLFALPMTDVQVAATYVGDPAGNLVNGNIQGFVSATDAAAVNVETDIFTGPLTDLLDEADQDGDGWIFHLSFTAVPTEWTGA